MPDCTGSLQIPSWRIVARVNRIGQKFVLVIGPELADVRVALDHRIDELPVLALAFANEHVAHNVAEVVELDWPARRVGERDLMKSLGERAAVIGLGVKLCNRGLDALARDVHAGRVTAGQDLIIPIQSGYETFVARRIEVRRIPMSRHYADGLVPK